MSGDAARAIKPVAGEADLELYWLVDWGAGFLSFGGGESHAGGDGLWERDALSKP